MSDSENELINRKRKKTDLDYPFESTKKISKMDTKDLQNLALELLK